MLADISAVLAITGKKPEAWESTFARSVTPLLMNSLSYSKMILITLIISTAQTAGRNLLLMLVSWKENSTAYPATTKWVSLSVGHVGDQLKVVWWMPWANNGMWSILFVQNVKSHSWVIVIMREKAWRIVKPTTISYLVMFVSIAIVWLKEMLCLLWIRHGVWTVLRVRPATLS